METWFDANQDSPGAPQVLLELLAAKDAPPHARARQVRRGLSWLATHDGGPDDLPLLPILAVRVSELADPALTEETFARMAPWLARKLSLGVPFPLLVPVSQLFADPARQDDVVHPLLRGLVADLAAPGAAAVLAALLRRDALTPAIADRVLAAATECLSADIPDAEYGDLLDVVTGHPHLSPERMTAITGAVLDWADRHPDSAAVPGVLCALLQEGPAVPDDVDQVAEALLTWIAQHPDDTVIGVTLACTVLGHPDVTAPRTAAALAHLTAVPHLPASAVCRVLHAAASEHLDHHREEIIRVGAGWVAARPEDPYLLRVVPLLAVRHGDASPAGQRLIGEAIDLVAFRPATSAAIRWAESRTGTGAGPLAERLRAWITDHQNDIALQLLRRMVINEVLDPTWTDWAAETALSRLHDTHLSAYGIHLLRTLAGSTRLGVDLCDRSVGRALRWFAGSGDHPSAQTVLRTTLGATRCGAPALAEAARTALTWAGEHPDHPERLDVLRSLLLGYTRHDSDAVNRAALLVLDWADSVDTADTTGPVPDFLRRVLDCGKVDDEVLDRARVVVKRWPSAADLVVGRPRRTADPAQDEYRELTAAERLRKVLASPATPIGTGDHAAAEALRLAESEADPCVAAELVRAVAVSTRVSTEWADRGAKRVLELLDADPDIDTALSQDLLRAVLGSMKTSVLVVDSAMERAAKLFSAADAVGHLDLARTLVGGTTGPNGHIDAVAEVLLSWADDDANVAMGPDLLRIVITGSKVRHEHVAAAASAAVGWIAANPDSDDRVPDLLRALVGAPRPDEVAARPARPIALRWAEAHLEDPRVPGLLLALMSRSGLHEGEMARVAAVAGHWFASFPDHPLTERLRRRLDTVRGPGGGLPSAGEIADRLGEPNGPDLLRAALLSPATDADTAATLAARALDWLRNHPDDPRWLMVAMALASSSQVTGADADRGAELVLEWRARHPDDPAVPDAVRAVAGGTKVGRDLVDEAAETALEWVESADGDPRGAVVLQTLLGNTRASFEYAQWAAVAANALIAAQPDRPDLAALVNAVVRSGGSRTRAPAPLGAVLTWVEVNPAARATPALVRAIVAATPPGSPERDRAARHLDLTDEPLSASAHASGPTLSDAGRHGSATTIENAVRHVVDDPTASGNARLLPALLADPTLTAAQAAATADAALTWLQANETHWKKTWVMLQALLSAPCLDETMGDRAAGWAVDLARRVHPNKAGLVLRAVLKCPVAGPVHAASALRAAERWLSDNPDHNQVPGLLGAVVASRWTTAEEKARATTAIHAFHTRNPDYAVTG